MAKLFESHVRAEKGLIENERQTYKYYKIEDLKDLKVFLDEFVPYYRDLAQQYGKEVNEELIQNFPVDYARRKDTKCIFAARIFNQMIETNLPKLKLRMTDTEKKEFIEIYNALDSVRYKTASEEDAPDDNVSKRQIKGTDRVLRAIQHLEVTNYYLNIEMALDEFLKEVKATFKLCPDFADKEVEISFHTDQGDGLLSGHKVYTAQIKDADVNFSISIEPDYRLNYSNGTVVYYVVDARITQFEEL